MGVNSKGKRTLVTGSAGLLGTYMVRELLQQGYHVRAMYHNTLPELNAHSNLEFFKANILDIFDVEDAFEGIDIVYHCAGLVSYQKEDAIKIYKVNVEGTANIVNRALEAGIEKLIHVSSVAALGKLPEQKMITGKMIWINRKEVSIYGHSKFLGEMEVWRGMAEGLNAVIINPSIILGAGNWNEGSTKIFRTVYDGFPWYSPGIMGFVAAKDVASAMLTLAESGVKEERFIISADNFSYKNLFDNIADGFAVRRPYKKVTNFTADLVVLVSKVKKIFTGKPAFITRETATTAMDISLYDNSKFLSLFPAFKYQTLLYAVQEICADLKQNLNKQ